MEGVLYGLGVGLEIVSARLAAGVDGDCGLSVVFVFCVVAESVVDAIPGETVGVGTVAGVLPG